MKQSDTILIAGSGPSAMQYQWPTDMPIMAVSSGYQHVPRMDHFVSLDKAMCFPEWLTDSHRFDKHTAKWDRVDGWRDCPRVRPWPYRVVPQPNFGEGPISAGPMRSLNHGEATWHNSLLFAVQLAPRLGYTRCVFIGVDLLGELAQVADVLKHWYPAAQDAGIQWFNASPLSTLCEWMPEAERMMEVAA